MQSMNPKNVRFVMFAGAALLALFVLAGCGDDDRDMEEMMMPAPMEEPMEEVMMPTQMGYKVTVTNNLDEEFFAPIVVTHASNDSMLFTADNYVTAAAQDQILTGSPMMVIEAIGEGNAVYDHGDDPKPNDPTARVLLGPGKSRDIMFEQDATALRILSMVAPTMVPDNYVSAVADVDGLMPGETITVPLSRFDIGYDEMTMDNMRLMEISLVGENAGTVRIERLGEMAAEVDMMDAANYTVEVTNELTESGEFFAPIVVARVSDERSLFDGLYVTKAAEEQILTGDPALVLAAIEEDSGDAVAFHGDAGPPGVLLAAGMSVPGMLETDATALRILAMVAPTPEYPDNYVTAVVNVASLMSGDYVMAPLTRFDIGHDEMTMDITQVDSDMAVGMVKITRQ